MKFTSYLYVALATACLASCASHKTATQTTTNTTVTTTTTAVTKTAKADKADAADAFITKVYENEVYQRNIVAKLTFSLNKGQGNVSVPGQLRMRKDQVVRLQLQLPLLGSEVGRLEFTPDGVLLVDRIHKQYCRASYDDVSFLADNGITFYTLQALFWNRLTLPGEESIGYGELSRFTVGTAQTATSRTPVSVESGKLAFKWLAETATGLIRQATVTYRDEKHGASTLTWTYDNLKQFGSKKFPYVQKLAVSTAATGSRKNIALTLDMESITADDSWEATTTVSDKYEEVTVAELLSQLITL